MVSCTALIAPRFAHKAPPWGISAMSESYFGAWGQQFYWDYLSFEQNEEHWYELLWRLSLVLHEEGPERWRTGTFEAAWRDSKKPPVSFVRDESSGGFVKTNDAAFFHPKPAPLQ